MSTVSAIELTMHFKHRGSWADHEFGLIVQGLKDIDPASAIASAVRQTFVGASATSKDEDLTDSVFGGANPANRLLFCTSSKQLLPPNPDSEGFCNTCNKWFDEKNKVYPSSVRITLTFAKPVSMLTFDDGTSDIVVPYLISWYSGSVGTDPDNTQEARSTDLVKTPPMIAGSKVATMQPIYVLGGCESFRPCYEKHSIHHVYHRFLEFLQSGGLLAPTWWDNFRDEELAIEAVSDPERHWTPI